MHRLLALLAGWLLLASTASAQTGYPGAITETRRVAIGAIRVDVLVDSSAFGWAGAELAELTFPAGMAGGAHRHTAHELFYVLEGELLHTVNGALRRLGPGMVGVVRAGDVVQHGVGPDGPVRVLAVWTPGGEVARITRNLRGATVHPIASVADALGALRQLREGWADAYNRGALDAMRDLYTPDAVRMPYDAPAQVGRDSILAGYARGFVNRPFVPQLQLVPAEIEIRGDLAIERGSYAEVLTPRTTGRALREDGKYVSLARRGPDGRWRFEWSIFNRDAPARPL